MLIGKRELFAFAERQTGSKMSNWSDLTTGQCIAELINVTMPLCRIVVPRLTVHSHSQQSSLLWQAISGVVRALRLPESCLNRKRLERQCKELGPSTLVLFFFLFNLSKNPDFTAEFSVEVVPELTQFLQSPDCVFSLVKGGALRLDMVPTAMRVDIEALLQDDHAERSVEMTHADVREDYGTQFVSPSPMAVSFAHGHGPLVSPPAFEPCSPHNECDVPLAFTQLSTSVAKGTIEFAFLSEYWQLRYVEEADRHMLTGLFFRSLPNKSCLSSSTPLGWHSDTEDLPSTTIRMADIGVGNWRSRESVETEAASLSPQPFSNTGVFTLKSPPFVHLDDQTRHSSPDPHPGAEGAAGLSVPALVARALGGLDRCATFVPVSERSTLAEVRTDIDLVRSCAVVLHQRLVHAMGIFADERRRCRLLADDAEAQRTLCQAFASELSIERLKGEHMKANALASEALLLKRLSPEATNTGHDHVADVTWEKNDARFLLENERTVRVVAESELRDALARIADLVEEVNVVRRRHRDDVNQLRMELNNAHLDAASQRLFGPPDAQ